MENGRKEGKVKKKGGRERERDRQRELDYGIGSLIMETEKYHDLPSASWTPREACDMIQSKYNSS
jgi:hypothetical protein